MRSWLIAGLNALLFGMPAVVGAQPAQPEPYDLKGDRLGMDLDQFKANHKEPGAWFIENVCVQSKCKPEKVWKSRLQCKEETAITTFCTLSSTIAEIPAGVSAFFIEKKLVALNVSFTSRDDWFTSVFQALTTKLGPPVSQTQTRVGAVIHWDNGASVALLQQHSCYSPRLLGAAAYGWSDEISSSLRGQDCAENGALSYRDSRVLYVHRALGATAQQRIDEAIKNRAAKSRSDI